MLICFFVLFVLVPLSLSLSLSMGAPGKLMNRLTGYGGRIHLHCHAMLHKLTKEQGGGRHLIIVKRPRMQDLKLHLIIVKRPRMQDLILHLVMTKRLRKTARVPSKMAVKTDNDDNNAQDALHKNGQQNFHFQSE